MRVPRVRDDRLCSAPRRDAVEPRRAHIAELRSGRRFRKSRAPELRLRLNCCSSLRARTRPVPSVHCVQPPRECGRLLHLQSVPTRLRTAAFLLLAVSWASLVAAQTPVLDPRFLEFSASADHSTTAATGDPMVTRYDLEFYAIGAPAPFQTNPLGKPAPNTSGVVRIDLSTIFAGFPTGTTYEARVAAVGPGGVSRSGVSNQFAFSNPCATTLTPTSTSVGSAAGTGTVAVATGGGCNWTATSNAAWVTLTSGLSGIGNGSVNYSVAANALTSAR